MLEAEAGLLSVNLGGVSAPFTATSPPYFQIISGAVGAAGAGERAWELPRYTAVLPFWRSISVGTLRS